MKTYKKVVIGILIIVLLGFIYYKESQLDKPGPVPYSQLSEKEKLELEIDNLKTENSKLQDEIHSLNSQMEELQDNYEYDEELINLLQTQLKEHGIEPLDL